MYFHCIPACIYQPCAIRLGPTFREARILYTHDHCSYTFADSRYKKKPPQLQFKNARGPIFFPARPADSRRLRLADHPRWCCILLLSVSATATLLCVNDKRARDKESRVFCNTRVRANRRKVNNNPNAARLLRVSTQTQFLLEDSSSYFAFFQINGPRKKNIHTYILHIKNRFSFQVGREIREPKDARRNRTTYVKCKEKHDDHSR